MDNAHTPGPWTVETHPSGHPVSLIESQHGLAVANFVEWDDPRWQQANARLIAAAPDLLAALKTLRDWREPQPKKLDAALAWRQNDDLVEEMVEAAIAKAEGRS